MADTTHGATDALQIDFAKGDGLIPVIAQDADDGMVLMLGYMNEESYKKTLALGEMVYWSRSRGKLWHKGETSGHVQKVIELLIDCDEDTIVARVQQIGGAACHRGYRSCFYRRIHNDGSAEIISDTVFDPNDVYNNGGTH